jgi:hypothetical protein
MKRIGAYKVLPLMSTKMRDIYAEFAGKTKFESYELEDEYDKKTDRNCNKCSITKTRFDFQNNTCGNKPFGSDLLRYKRGECKGCQHKESLGKSEAMKIAKTMGLDTKAPKGTECELCKKTKGIVFDHCHQNKLFRGWLCDPCNRSIGVLGDSSESIVRVFNYLNKFEKKKFTFTEECMIVSNDNT